VNNINRIYLAHYTT